MGFLFQSVRGKTSDAGVAYPASAPFVKPGIDRVLIGLLKMFVR